MLFEASRLLEIIPQATTPTDEEAAGVHRGITDGIQHFLSLSLRRNSQSPTRSQVLRLLELALP